MRCTTRLTSLQAKHEVANFMPVTGLVVTERRAMDGGASFGEWGPYEEIRSSVSLEIDPQDPEVSGIVDLDLAIPGPDGKVRFQADLVVARPSAEQTARGLVVDVPNRGRVSAGRWLNNAKGHPVPTHTDTGTGFLMRQGYIVVRIGWQEDVPVDAERVRLHGPEVRDVTGPIVIDFQLPERATSVFLGDRDHQPYPPVASDISDATLSVRAYQDGPRRTVPRSTWRFVSGNGTDEVSHIALAGGFDAGAIYELRYLAHRPRVLGLGMATLNLITRWLRHGGGREARLLPEADIVLAYGESQTSRLLREILYTGMDSDDAGGSSVFDGILMMVPGARRGEFNVRFGQPSRNVSDGWGAQFPFADRPLRDPPSTQPDGLLVRRDPSKAPRLMTVNTSTEYWGGDRGSGGQASLLHSDLDGTSDVLPEEFSRHYLVAGAQHVPLPWPVGTVDHLGIRCNAMLGSIDHRPLQRALLVALDSWVRDGVEPPSSAIPRWSDGTACQPDTALQAIARVPGTVLPSHLPVLRRLDFAPANPGHPTRVPPSTGAPYGWFVSGLDDDANEIAGIRLPDVAAPLATYLGMNTRHPDSGEQPEIVPAAGSTLPFARSTREAQDRRDPRVPIGARYPSRSHYLSQIDDEVTRLIGQRLMLRDDRDDALRLAGSKWDAWAR